MKKLLLVCAFICAPAHAGGLPAEILVALKAAKLPGDSLSLAIVPLQSSLPAVYFQGDKPSSPASTMKLLTTYAGLSLLGPAYQWNTEISSTVKPMNGILDGDLYIKGYGDPKLNLERFWLMLRDLKTVGVKEIRGDLVLDRSFFSINDENAIYDDDGDEPHRPFLVAPDSLLSNLKSLRLTLRAEAGGVMASLEPNLASVQIDNQLSSSPAASCAALKNKLQLAIDNQGSSAKIVLSGSMPLGCTSERYLALLDHPSYTASLFRSLWAELGGVITGANRTGVVPAEAQVLLTARSPDLASVIRDINKFSNNTMASQLYLSLGTVETGHDSSAKSFAAVQHWLAGRGKTFDELKMENGSGLSRQEQISARHMADLLIDAWQSPYAAEFISSLPLVALDGTMKKRLGNMAGEAHIKTGTLRDVRAAAGYVRDINGQTSVVVAMINHPQASAGLPVLDAILRFVHLRVTK
ncbi:D-alanyl-D-alanine carboxypeptidase/D-alanyl-D-alanine endopeptidase [Iodobacter ciconiae]|uniref:D-alanyl-D-alanine carboxypeptidase/D-alanyl-D-alanine endopeptidase n=1 Tax=Iodobacter ciconiae TaxID=2496266 RepID=UPI0013E083E8|nr:D-alanyl-D-alanine carboxypeptidase/D-alanyl-D-alanine-endopeptidase [Iodobacter ciconiae]